MSGFESVVVIDGKDHFLGKLASVVAKQLLEGQRVVVVRCEGLTIPGDFLRNKLRYLQFLRKATRYNPRRGPFHFRAPSRIFYRAVRGMIKHNTARGKAAMERLSVFEGVPAPYDHRKRVVVPKALRVLVAKPGSKYTTLSRLSREVGWKYESVIQVQEERRIAKSIAHHAEKKAQLEKLRAEEAKLADTPESKRLAELGYISAF